MSTIDISCYYLGSNVFTAGLPPIIPDKNAQGVFIIPSGTIIPPGGFCLLRGENAAQVPSNLLVQNGGNVVEIVIPGNITDPGICVINDTRLWFPDLGGWFGFYDNNGTPQDAVSWATLSGTNNALTCIPTTTGCSNSVTQLSSYDSFPNDRKTKVYNSATPTGQLTGDLLTGDNLTIATATPGNYSVAYEYATPEGCQSSYTKNFTVGSELQVSYNVGQDCFQNITLSVQPIVGSFTSFKWYDENMALLGTSNPYIGHVETAGEHTFALEATDNHGCKAFYSSVDYIVEGINASMFQIPNVVTPNDDNVNDFILMPLMDNDCIEYKVLILNRWGNLVYEATKANPTFEGKDMKGHKLTDGVYFYKIVSNDIDCDSTEFKPMCYCFITIASKKE